MSDLSFITEISERNSDSVVGISNHSLFKQVPIPPIENVKYPDGYKIHLIDDEFLTIVDCHCHVYIYNLDYPLGDPIKIMSLPSVDMDHYQQLVIDHKRKRIIVNDRKEYCFKIYSWEDCSFIHKINYKDVICGMSMIYNMIISIKSQRLILSRGINGYIDTENPHVWNLDNFSYLPHEKRIPELGFSLTSQIGALDNQGRYIRISSTGRSLEVLSSTRTQILTEKTFLSYIMYIIFNKARGIFIINTCRDGINIIAANEWLSNTFEWKPKRHKYAPLIIKEEIFILTMIRSLEFQLNFSLLPNELLFQIFRYL